MLGLGTLARKVFGTPNDRAVKSVRPLVAKINALEAEISVMDDDRLKGQTQIFRDRLAAGETLDDILPEAFATVREASKRVMGMRHFDVQMVGGIVLHRGEIAEMRTGEGKTLVATFPAYLNALTGKGVHVVTVNDYLAKRDADPRGMNVVAADNVVAGTISDVWVDRSEYMIRYLEVQVANSPKRVLVPMPMVVIQGGRKRVKVNALLASQFENIPQLASPDQITRDEEERVSAYVGAGTLYATPARSEALL